MNGKYLHPWLVGVITRMRKQCVPGSVFPPPTKSLGTWLGMRLHGKPPHYISVPNLLVCCTIFKAGGKGLGLMLQVHVCIFEGNLYTCTGIHTYSTCTCMCTCTCTCLLVPITSYILCTKSFCVLHDFKHACTTVCFPSTLPFILCSV